MSTDDRKVSLSSSVDPTGARDGIQQIKQELGTLPGAAQQAAQATSAPLDKMGSDAEKASKKVEASTRSLVSQIQRQDAALASGGKNTAAYFETIAKQRGLDTAVLTPYLNQLRETERAQLAANKALDGTGMSAKATAAALRQVPAQFTDIVTALASGQQPLTVLLQQGGQLKDAFGGVGNAAKALAGYVVGLVNPFTLVAGAAAGLSIAAYQGAQELPAFQKQLILSGQAAGVTASQLAAARNAAAELSGATKGRAAEVLASIASSAGIGAANLTRFTAAALAFERAGGDAAEKTADAFKALATDPLNAALKLNDTTAFLTRSTYEQIKALTDQGRVAEAAKVAQEAYFRSVSDKIPALEKNLGSLQVAWRGVKDFAASAWDAMLNVGREDTIDTQIQKMQKAMAANQKWINAGLFAGSLGQANADFQSQIDALTQQKKLDEDSARAKAEQAKQVKLLAEYQKDNIRYLTTEEQLRLAIKQATEDGVAAGAKQEDIQRRIAALRQQYDPRLYEEEISAAETQRNEAIKRSVIEINALRAAGRINEYEGVTRLARADIAAMESEKTTLTQQLGFASQRINSEKEVAQLRTQIAAVTERQLTREKQLQADLLTLQRARRTALLQFYEAEAEQNRSDIDAYQRKEFDNRAELEKQQLASADALKEETDLLRLQTSLMGSAEDVRARAIAQYKAALDLKRQIRAIDETDLPGGEAEREEKRSIARQQAAQAMVNAQQRATVDAWQKTTDQIYDSLTDALLRGFESGKSFAQNFRDTLKNMFSTLVLRPVVQWALGPITSGLGALFGGGSALASTGGAAAAASGGSGLFGSLSSLGSIGSFAQLAGQFGALKSIFGLGAQLTGWTGAGTLGALEGAGSMIANGSITQGLAQGAGALAPWALGGAAGLYGGRAISGGYSAFGNSGNSAVNVGTIAGAIFAGPLGAAIGGAIGGVVNRAFGRGPKTVQEAGIQGAFTGGELTGGQTYSQWKQKGGWFRSDKTGTDYGALDSATTTALGDAASAMYASTMEWAKTLGLPAEELANVTTKFKTKLTGDTEKDQAAITELLNTYQAALTGKFSSALKPFQKAGEDLTATLQRLVVVENFSQAINDLGGIFTKVAHSSVDAKEGLLALVGGADNFIQMANGYVSNFYNRDEIAGLKASSIKDTLAGLGITQDFSGDSAKAQFRALVDQTDVNSAEGQKRLATLLGIQGDFSNLAAYLSETGKSLQDVATQAPNFDALAPLLASGTTQQVGAINGVRDAIVSLEQTVRETSGGSGASTSPTKGWIEVGVAP